MPCESGAPGNTVSWLCLNRNDVGARVPAFRAMTRCEAAMSDRVFSVRGV
jgi:hypothetical protein